MTSQMNIEKFAFSPQRHIKTKFVPLHDVFSLHLNGIKTARRKTPLVLA